MSACKHSSTLILAAGGILWDGAPGRSRIALVYRPRHGDWSLPKGKVEPGETLEETALREVAEETGLDVTLDRFAGVVHYEVRGKPKLVFFWHMTAIELTPFEPNDEVTELAWRPVDEAIEKLDYETERDVVRRST